MCARGAQESGVGIALGKHLRSIGAIASKQADKLVDSRQMSPRTRAEMQVPDASCRISSRPSRLLEIIRGRPEL